MKKLLALVLALVMSMSLVTISNAAFKDADKIDYKEAVDVMNAVGVFIGDEKGNFNAKENLTREQAAKIIAYLELGSKAADALPGGAFFKRAHEKHALGVFNRHFCRRNFLFLCHCRAAGVDLDAKHCTKAAGKGALRNTLCAVTECAFYGVVCAALTIARSFSAAALGSGCPQTADTTAMPSVPEATMSAALKALMPPIATVGSPAARVIA